MQIELKQILYVTTLLFAIIDIVGSIPVIINLNKQVGTINTNKTTVVSMCLMLGSLFAGEILLRLVGLDVSSFAIAGALVIFCVALEMILGLTIFKHDSVESVSIVPLAFPMIVGAGTMTTLISLKAECYLPNIIIGVLINIFIIYIVLKNTNRIGNLLGKTGILIMRKAFGLILLAIAIKVIRKNLGI